MAMRKTNGTKHLKKVASFGAAMSTLAIAPHAQAAVIDLTGNLPASLAYGAATFLNVLGPGSSAFQFNDSVGKSLSAFTNGMPDTYVVGFQPAQASQSISAFIGTFSPFLFISPSASGTQIYGFVTNKNQVGWIQMNLGGAGGNIVYLAAAYEEFEEIKLHISPPGSSVPEPTSTALLGLGMLAMGASGVRRLRKERREKKQPDA